MSDIYRQLAFDFDKPLRAEKGEKIIESSPFQATLEVLKNLNQRHRGDFTAVFRDYVPFGNRVVSLFDRMADCEELLKKGFYKYPYKAQIIDRVFGIACPTPVLGTSGWKLYNEHINELIDRAGQDLDTREATRAEIVAAIYGISLMVPTKKFVGRAYWYLFQQILPGEAKKLSDELNPIFPLGTKWDQEEMHDFIGGLAKKIYQKDRIIQPHRLGLPSWNLKEFWEKHPEYKPTPSLLVYNGGEA